MAALNFPDHDLVTRYTNPDTGITYEWINNSWKSVRTAQTSFVDSAGDNLTGNLTLGTDKIVLNATTGAATFSSTVDATAFTINGIPIGGSSSQTIVSDTMPTPTNYNTGTLWWNSESSDTSLYVLYQDPTGPDGDPGGKYWIEASPAPDSIGFNGSHTGDSTFTGNMNVTGAGTFGGEVIIGNANYYNKFYTSGTHEIFNQDWPNGNNAFDIQGSTGTVAKILGNGSATFANYVTSNEGFYAAQTAAPNGSSIFKSWLGASTYVDILDNGSASFDGTISDSIGPLRKLGSNTQSGAYTLVATDAGKFVAQSSNSAAVTVPNGVFAAGDMVTVVNLTATNINIVQGSGLDLNFTADGTTGTRTLAQKGVCTILFVSSGTSFISGSGLS